MTTHLLKTGIAGLCGLLFIAGHALKAESSSASTDSRDLLSEALPILKTKYVLSSQISVRKGDHLSDLIARSDGLISLVPTKTEAAPMVTALLPGNIIYWRLSSFTPASGWPELAAQLDQWTKQGVEGAILDLRSTTSPDNYDGAAQVAAFFSDDNKPPFSFEGSSMPDVPVIPFHPGQILSRPIVVIINHETKCAGEVLAEFLQQQGALVVGQASPGHVAVFSRQQLSSGQTLRYAVEFINLEPNHGAWDGPVVPDVGLTINAQAEKNALAMIEKQGVLDVIRESAERRRMSEASLVHGQDPELDDYLTAHEKKADATHPAPVLFQDVALINAMDSLKAIRLSQRRTASSFSSSGLPTATASTTQ